MLKFVVVIFLLIMASTFAQQCGDKVCDAGSCCVEYFQRHCQKFGQLHEMCYDILTEARMRETTYFFALVKLAYTAI
uniref:U25-Hexatoxin-Hc1ck_1 n=1 Tax=Hadronyche cerberea TaxID=1107879 RepID=A0A4V2H9I2_HADCE